MAGDARGAGGARPPTGRARAAWTLGLLDLRLVASDRASAFWMLVFPVLLMWFFGMAFGGGGDAAAPAVEIAVRLEDEGPLGALFVETLAAEGVTVRMRGGSPAAGAEQEDTLRLLTIPAGFTAQVLAREPLKLSFPVRGGERGEFDRAADVEVYKAVVRFLARLVLIEKDAGARAAAIPDLAGRYRALASKPDRIAVSSETAGRGRPVPAGFAQSVPGTLTMSILMMTVIYGAVFLTFERTAGMLRRQGTLPVDRPTLIAGKLAGRLLIAGVQVVILLLVSRFLFRVDVGRSPAALVLVAGSYTIAAASFGLLFGTLYRSPEQAGATGWIPPLIMAALGGCWWPLEVVPRWMRAVGHLFPTAWAMDGFHRIISFGEGAGAVLPVAAVLTAYGIAVSFVAIRLLRWD